MKNIYKVALLSVGFQLSADESVNYLLLLKMRDCDNNTVVSVLSGNQLKEKEQFVSLESVQYDNDVWEAVLNYCQRTQPKEDEWYVLLPVIHDKANRFLVQLPLKKAHAGTYSFIVDPKLFIEQALCVFSEGFDMRWFFPYKKALPIQAPEVIPFDDYELDSLDELELMRDQPEPSKITVFARRVGVGLFLRYLEFTQFLKDRWKRMKTYIAEYV